MTTGETPHPWRLYLAFLFRGLTHVRWVLVPRTGRLETLGPPFWKKVSQQSAILALARVWGTHGNECHVLIELMKPDQFCRADEMSECA